MEDCHARRAHVARGDRGDRDRCAVTVSLRRSSTNRLEAGYRPPHTFGKTKKAGSSPPLNVFFAQRRATTAILSPFALTAMRVMLFNPALLKSPTSLQLLPVSGITLNNLESFAISSAPDGIQA